MDWNVWVGPGGNEQFDTETDAYSCPQGDILPTRLPADLDLMVLNEIVPIVTAEILKSYWCKGGHWKAVHQSSKLICGLRVGNGPM